MASNTSPSWQAQELLADVVVAAAAEIAELLLLNLLPRRQPTMFHLLRHRRPERTIQSYSFTRSMQLELSVDAKKGRKQNV
jgi:hypothetical protein